MILMSIKSAPSATRKKRIYTGQEKLTYALPAIQNRPKEGKQMYGEKELDVDMPESEWTEEHRQMLKAVLGDMRARYRSAVRFGIEKCGVKYTDDELKKLGYYDE